MPSHNIVKRCTAQIYNGEFCDAPSADDMPFPICALHATRVYRRVGEMATGALLDPATGLLRTLMSPPPQERRSERPQESVVYYVLIGPHIKIGFTTTLKTRMHAYPPSRKLLAVEPGDLSKERLRHQQFRAHLAMGNEWFHPATELIEHINGLRRLAGSPPLKTAA